MKGIKFQLSNYLGEPVKASGAQLFLSMIFAALIDHMLNFHFSWFPLKQKSRHIVVCVMQEHHVKPGLCLSKATCFDGRDKSRMGTSKRPHIFDALPKPGSDNMEMAPSYCASQAHRRIRPLHTKSVSLLSLLVLVYRALTREQTPLFPTL